MLYHAVPSNTMQYPAIPCNIMQYHAIPCNTMQYHAIPCNTMQYNAVPCNTMQYQASLITADGAYHCPVGSKWPFFNSSWTKTEMVLLHLHCWLWPLPKQQCIVGKVFFRVTSVSPMIDLVLVVHRAKEGRDYSSKDKFCAKTSHGYEIYLERKGAIPLPLFLFGLKYIWKEKVQFSRFPFPLSSYWLLTMAGAEVGKHSGNQVD